ncbi:MAG: kelch repeat-containing protein [Candidatus Thorarchaeota archaeon]
MRFFERRFIYGTIILTCIFFSSNIGLSNVTDIDDITYEWEEMKNAGNPGRLQHLNLAYDIKNDKMILAGGRYVDGTLSNKTWAFSFDTNMWADRNPLNIFPVRQWSHMTYNSVENTTIIMGGGAQYGDAINDLWEYDYLENNWTELAPHPTRGWIFPRFTFVDSLNALFFFGGANPRQNWIIENWWYFFSNNTWKPVSPKSMPSEFLNGSLLFENLDWSFDVIYYKDLDTILLFKPEDVYEYSITNNDWTDLNATGDGSPVGRTDIFYNPNTDLFYRFGGFFSDGSFSGKTWSFNYHTKKWQEIIFTGVTPPSRDTDSNIEFNPKLNLALLYGGAEGIYLNDTWHLKMIDPSAFSSSSNTGTISGTNSSTTTTSPQTSSIPLIFMVLSFSALIIVRKRKR